MSLKRIVVVGTTGSGKTTCKGTRTIRPELYGRPASTKLLAAGVRVVRPVCSRNLAGRLPTKLGSTNFRVLTYAKGKDFWASLDHSLAIEMRNLSGAPIPNCGTLTIGTLHKRALYPSI